LEYKKNNPKNDTYSVQNLVDCEPESDGCDGGYIGDAFKYVQKKGISNGLDYKYTGKTETCKRNSTTFPPIYKLQKYCWEYLSGNEESMKNILAQNGPLVVRIRE
jgi:hypothetical protein